MSSSILYVRSNNLVIFSGGLAEDFGLAHMIAIVKIQEE
jgi:hypothetical protein